MTNPTKDITINGNKYEIAIPKERVTDFPSLAKVATSGSYNDLANKPAIPSIDDLATESWVEGKNYLTEHQDISGKVDKEDGKGLSSNDLTDALKSNYDAAYTHSQEAHAPSDALKNVQSDWNALSGDALILNKPTIPSIEGLATEEYVDNQFYTEHPDNIIINGYEAVDLGLTSNGKHLLWAACNVGATTPEGYGLLFQWGRTDGYAYGSALGTSFEAKDGLIRTSSIPTTTSGATYAAGATLSLADDAANANMGGSWRMPTKDEISALVALGSTWTTENGVYGRKFTGNGNSIFIPAAGYFDGYDGSFYFSGSRGYVWASSVFSSNGNYAYSLYFDSGYCRLYNYSRYFGFSVRGIIELTDDELETYKKSSKYYTKSEVNALIPNISNLYTKPNGGIPFNDLSSDIQNLLNSISTIGTPASDDYIATTYYVEGDTIPEGKNVGDVKTVQVGTAPTGIYARLYALEHPTALNFDN